MTKPRMPVEDMAYSKMGMSVTKVQRSKWNDLNHKMYLSSDFLLDRSRSTGHSDKAERLHALICQLPVFSEDGREFNRSGTAVEDF